MINHELNRRFFHRDSLLRDNETVTIRTFIRILATHMIIQEMKEIPLVCSDVPALIMTTPTVFPNYIINNDIEGNKSGVEILNNITLGIHRTQEMHIKCTVKHCDRKKPHEIMNQGCV